MDTISQRHQPLITLFVFQDSQNFTYYATKTPARIKQQTIRKEKTFEKLNTITGESFYVRSLSYLNT